MILLPVSEALAARGFHAPSLNILDGSNTNYRAFLLQPSGTISVDGLGVKNKNRNLARAQYLDFLKQGAENGADLVVTPEYSTPWEVLGEALDNGKAPAKGKLWVIGCEAIKYHDLKRLKLSGATTIFEDLPDQEGWVDPLAYIFRSEKDKGGDGLVVLVQFKTTPMADRDHFELNALHCGTVFYHFTGQPIRLLSLICSDVLSLDDAEARRIYDRSLVIHIQLNPAPRNPVYRRYRDDMFDLAGDATEIVCLNWAKGLTEEYKAVETIWSNFPLSAWYLKKNEHFDRRDETLSRNHKNGLYFTWDETVKAHALYFNSSPAAFLLTVSKVAHVNVKGVVARRRGPQLESFHMWDDTAEKWIVAPSADDGFGDLIAVAGGATVSIRAAYSGCAIKAERMICLSSGTFDPTKDWYSVDKLKSFVVDGAEQIKRITFCQDNENGAEELRMRAIRRCAVLSQIIAAEPLPPAISTVRTNYALAWSQERPYSNVKFDGDKVATVIYLGEDQTKETASAFADKLVACIGKSEATPSDTDTAIQRTAIWYRSETGYEIANKNSSVRFDRGAPSGVSLDRDDNEV